jgi:hypothetical protein
MMPLCDGGSLANAEYVDILAFILSANGAGAGPQELTPSAGVTIGDIIAKKPAEPSTNP